MQHYGYNDEVRSIQGYVDSVIDGLADMIRRREELPALSDVVAECIEEPCLMAPRRLVPRVAREAIVYRAIFGAGDWGNRALVRKYYLQYFFVIFC